MQFLEDDIERRYHKDKRQRTYRHTSGHADSQRAVTVSTRAALYDQRYHTGNHRYYRHQNRTQTIFACTQSGFNNRHTLLALLYGELGDQNSRLRQQTDQHDHTGLEVDVILLTEQP